MQLGSTTISKIYVGSTEITKVYLGAELVWDGGVEPTLFEQIIGLREGGITPCGRQSMATLKVPGVDTMPTGMSVSGNFVNISSSFSGDLVDWDFRNKTLSVNANAVVGEINNCVFGQTIAITPYFYHLDVVSTGRVGRVAYCDFIGLGTHEGAPTMINGRIAGTGTTVTIAELPIIEFNRFIDMQSDAIKVNGSRDTGGQVIRWNYFGWPKNLPQYEPAAWDSGTTYSIGDYVKDASRNVRPMISKVNSNLNNLVPTGTVSNDFWTVIDPHADGITTVAAVDSLEISNNLFDWIAPEGVYNAGFTNAFRISRNSGTDFVIDTIDVLSNVVYWPNTVSAPIQVLSGVETNFNGPISFVGNWLMPSSGGSYFHPSSNNWVDAWSGNVNTETGTAITGPTLRT